MPSQGASHSDPSRAKYATLMASNRIMFVATLIALLTCLPNIAMAASIDLEATKDTYVASTLGTPQGGTQGLIVGDIDSGSGQEIAAILLQFNVGSIPTNRR